MKRVYPVRLAVLCLLMGLGSAMHGVPALKPTKDSPKNGNVAAPMGLAPEGVPLIAQSVNPQPAVLPTLGVWDDEKLSPGRKLTMVSATFPNVPGFTCDSWCYEAGVPLAGARTLDGGRIELRHGVPESPGLTLVTTVTPEPGAVEFLARLEAGVGVSLPDAPPWLNLCWQVRRAPQFASEPGKYPQFAERCFLFTSKGRTYLHQTVRRPIPSRTLDDPYNRPPWVQNYVRKGQELPTAEAQAKSWAGYSTDRYTVPIIGVVSRDGKYLAALANDSATSMAQAWHDCLHNNPQWQPHTGPGSARVWRLKVYAMANDPDRLLARVAKDFPRARASRSAVGRPSDDVPESW
jgi:hypothetical protein